MVAERGEALDAMTGPRFDVVGWDIRGGAGASAPVGCFADAGERARFWDGLPVPTTRAEERRYLAKTIELAQRCGERNGELLAHISTADTARDLDHPRRLVGDRRLTYFGESFGTMIGQTYANLFPHRVRAMALDGVVESWAGSTPRARPGRPGAPTGTPVPGTPPPATRFWSSAPGSTLDAASQRSTGGAAAGQRRPAGPRRLRPPQPPGPEHLRRPGHRQLPGQPHDPTARNRLPLRPPPLRPSLQRTRLLGVELAHRPAVPAGGQPSCWLPRREPQRRRTALRRRG